MPWWLGVVLWCVVAMGVTGCAADVFQRDDAEADWLDVVATGQEVGDPVRSGCGDGQRVLTEEEFAAWLNATHHEIYIEEDNTFYDALRKTTGMAVQLAVAQTDVVGGSVEERTARLASLLEVIAAKFTNDWGVSRFDVGIAGEIPLFVGTKGPLYPMLLVHPVTGAVYGTRSLLGAPYLRLLESKPPQAFSELVKKSDVFSVQASPTGGTVVQVNFDHAHLYSRLP